MSDDTPRLLRALVLSRRFHLYLVTAQSPRAADQLVAQLETEVPRLRKAPAQVVRLDPYSGRESTERITDGELMSRVLDPLLLPEVERTVHGVVHVVDASRAVDEDVDAWRRVFSIWNEKRNAVQTSLEGEIVVVLPPSMTHVFASSAPDVWSVRSGEYEIAETIPDVTVRAHGVAHVETVHADASVQIAVRRSPRAWLSIPRVTLWFGDLVVAPWVNPLPTTAEEHAEDDDAVLSRALRGIYFEVEDVSLSALRLRLHADRALWRRKFEEAARRYSEVLAWCDGQASTLFVESQRALSAAGMSMAAGALGDAETAAAAIARARRSLANAGGTVGLRSAVSRANAYQMWLAGRGAEASATFMREIASSESPSMREFDALRERGERTHEREDALVSVGAIAMERGDIGTPFPWTKWRERPPPGVYLVEAERDALRGDVAAGRARLAALLAASSSDELAPEAEPTILARIETHLAFLELVDGDDRRATVRLGRLEHAFRATDVSEGERARAEAMLAHTRGVQQLAHGHHEDAAESFRRSEDAATRCARTAFDGPSLLRARAAARLGWLHAVRLGDVPADASESARQLVEWVDVPALDTGDDLVSRVLAIEAHRALGATLSRRDPSASRSSLRRAADLAARLEHSSVKAWSELARSAISAPAGA